MPRPREFDTDLALDAALDVFWTKGYAATSLDDLCLATGLSRSSLYGAFGGKRTLYFTSLDRYTRDGAAHIAQLLGSRPVRQAFETFVQRLIDDVVAGPGRRGCFIGNCAAELARRDRPAAERVRSSLHSIEQTFEVALQAARERRELPPETDVTGLARYLTTGIQGLRLLGKANPGREALEDVARWMFRAAWPSPASVATHHP